MANLNLANKTTGELIKELNDIDYDRSHFYRNPKSQDITPLYLEQIHAMDAYAKILWDEICYRREHNITITKEPMCECGDGPIFIDTMCADCFWEDDYDRKHRLGIYAINRDGPLKTEATLSPSDTFLENVVANTDLVATEVKDTTLE